jgi:hypothetical protein
VAAFLPLDITDPILYVVLYWFETWPLTIVEKHRFRVFENRLPRTIFEPNRKEGAGEWRKVHNRHNRDFHNVYSSLNTMKVR